MISTYFMQKTRGAGSAGSPGCGAGRSTLVCFHPICSARRHTWGHAPRAGSRPAAAERAGT